MKIYKLLFVITAVFFMTSCNSDFKDEISYEENGNTFPTTVAFTSSAFNVPEEGGAVPVSVELIGVARTSDITVNITIEETGAVAGENYTISSNADIVIPAGEYGGSISVTPIDDVLASESPQTFTITMTGTSSSDISIGSEEASGRMTVVEIVDNDCPFDTDGFVGTYNVIEAFTGPPNAPFGFSDFFGESYQIEMSVDASDTNGFTFTLNNSAGFDTFVPDGTTIRFVPCPEIIEFVTGDPVVAAFTTLTVVSTSFEEYAVRVDGDSNGFGDYGFTLEKQ
ncbi:hypothetical protein [Ekhidna sp.]|uniref:hypothetical protein n=1 Tax=Ekhidna sp. TaxID=2608089 RepID=UPI003B5028D2